MAGDTIVSSTAEMSRPREKDPVALGCPEDYFEPSRLPEDVFEIGIVLGGTVSVGSYTGGVLDFLIQALDEWSRARASEANLPQEQWTVPRHRVRLRILTGTSGGGICTLLAARALHYNFPPAVDGAKRKTLEANPFYDVWVNDIDLKKLLRCSDLEGTPTPPVLAALDGQVLEAIAKKGVNYPSPRQERVGRVTLTQRDYLYNPLQVVVTHSNLSGIPYRQAFTASSISAEYFTNHADYVRVYFDYPGPATGSLAILNPDARTVEVVSNKYGVGPVQAMAAQVGGGNPPASNITWPNLVQFALGTCAIPVGLPARQISRSAKHYAYRFAWDTVKREYRWLVPVWEKISPPNGFDNYCFTSWDGGCTDNEPIALARQALEGLGSLQTGRPSASATAPRYAGEAANRAIFLVDPLCEIPPHDPTSQALGLLGLLAPTAHMFVQANRFATADIADFLHPGVYNRFLIAPKRSSSNAPGGFQVGGSALCGDGLGAFLGFAHKSFRHHDFMLGRFNCQAFLTGTFALKKANPLFQGNGPIPAIPADYSGPQPENGEVPVIPLLGSAASPIKEPEWPGPGQFDPQTLKRAVRKRAGRLLATAIPILHMNLFERRVFCIVRRWLSGRSAELFIDAVRNELKRKGL